VCVIEDLFDGVEQRQQTVARAGETCEKVLLILTRTPLLHKPVAREYYGLSQQLDAVAVEEKHWEDVDLSAAAAPSERSCKYPRTFEKTATVIAKLLSRLITE
jgi:hypothetical protein